MTRNTGIFHSEEAYVRPMLDDPLEEDTTEEEQHEDSTYESEDSGVPVTEQDVALMPAASEVMAECDAAPAPASTANCSPVNVTWESPQEQLPHLIACNQEPTFVLNATPTRSGRL